MGKASNSYKYSKNGFLIVSLLDKPRKLLTYINDMKQDLQVFDLIRSEKDRQSSGLELIASENYVSDYVLEAMGSICTNKYAEGLSLIHI